MRKAWTCALLWRQCLSRLLCVQYTLRSSRTIKTMSPSFDKRRPKRRCNTRKVLPTPDLHRGRTGINGFNSPEQLSPNIGSKNRVRQIWSKIRVPQFLLRSIYIAEVLFAYYIFGREPPHTAAENQDGDCGYSQRKIKSNQLHANSSQSLLLYLASDLFLTGEPQ